MVQTKETTMVKPTRREDPAMREFWKQMVTKWQTSGMGIQDFCLREKLPESSFYRWRKRLMPTKHLGTAPAMSKKNTGRRSSVAKTGGRGASPSQGDPKSVFLPMRISGAPGLGVADLGSAPNLGLIELVLPSGYVLRLWPGLDLHVFRQLLLLLEAQSC
jgi:hypothetical protein